MPTGYTAGIIDGNITTFEQFAKQCMRAFGATIHMRDDSLEKEYEPRVPSSYYTGAFDTSLKNLKRLQSMSVEEFTKHYRGLILNEISSLEERIEETKLQKERLESMLKDVKKWMPPTQDHFEFKNFMAKQLEDTIRIDGDCSYLERSLKRAKEELKNFSAEKLMKKEIEREEENVKTYRASHREEVNRCAEASKWVSDLLDSLTVKIAK
jgi:DNA repair photolyase